jgi:hypothetical protein
MTFEIRVPEDWPPGLAMAVATLVRQSFDKGFPVIVPVRSDASPEEILEAFARVNAAIQDAGLAA